ncbi:MAG: hypothetical protein MUF72_20005 [Elainella sp. Prado103]|jgi:glycosyltransferase involved in cell wall biosynthesis|nr:hypothetical protein [Elainella sp. Prado103]
MIPDRIQKKICLVSPGHVASNPRLVKEANALHQAGYQVRVVAGDYMAAIRPLDQALLSQVDWCCVQVHYGKGIEYLRRRLFQAVARRIVAQIGSFHWSLATWAHHPISYRLAQVAAAEPADLYIAHCLAALPAVAIAARKHNARFGFDAEDFHIGELADTPENQSEIHVRGQLERSLLIHCHHLTAAAPGIASAYAEHYGVHMQPILNVFPRSEALSLPYKQQHQATKEPSLYWFSQTIGTGRGIEAVIQALGQMDCQVHLYLRGIPAIGYLEQLTQLAKKVGVRDRLHFLPPAPPGAMIQLAAEHDVGLSLELRQPLNRSLCLTNKIFTYLLAGLPIVMSRTPAQVEFSRSLGDAAVLVDIDDPQSIAMTLDDFFANPARIEHARAKAQELAWDRYNWEIEQKPFLESIEYALG